MISAIELKKSVANVSIFGIIIGKLRHKKKLCPIILFEVDKDLKISFHCGILSFGLTIQLWVKGSRESLFDAKKII